MDPPAALTVLVRRWRSHGYQRLELPDGKGWRLPRRDEIGLRCVPARRGAECAGCAFEAFAPDDYDPGRMHRWVNDAAS